MSGQIVRVGSRESRLAVIQSEVILNWIRENCPEIGTELVTMKTSGDRVLNRALEELGGKGLFVKELDRALLEGRTDLSVHSLKDLPMETPPELPVLGFTRREDPRDVLVLPQGVAEWDRSKPVGCASRRRAIQLRRLWPEVRVELIRGSVETRLRKLDEGQYGAIILAAAGLKRLGLDGRISRYFSPEEMLPAAGQGILAVQGRLGLDYGWLSGCFDREGACCALAERAFVRALGGGCSSPVAAYAVPEGEQLWLRGFYSEPDGTGCWFGELRGDAGEAEKLGLKLARKWKEETHGR